jgi:hypothetical protein
VEQLRQCLPNLKIVLRAGSGFCREALMAWCEANQVDYVFRLQRNTRLRRIIGEAMHQAQGRVNEVANRLPQVDAPAAADRKQ